MDKYRCDGGKAVMSRSSSLIRPAVGVSSPAISRKSVDFPQPEGPKRTEKRPDGRVMETSSSAMDVSKRRSSPHSSIPAAICFGNNGLFICADLPLSEARLSDTYDGSVTALRGGARSFSENIDTKTPARRLIFASVAQFAWDRISPAHLEPVV